MKTLINYLTSIWLWITSFFVTGKVKKKSREDELVEEMERQFKDERLQTVQRNEDEKISHFIHSKAMSLFTCGEPEDVIINMDLDLPEYNVWHEKIARFKDKPLKDYVITQYLLYKGKCD